jgi:membrane-associated phospholipid phosphatase
MTPTASRWRLACLLSLGAFLALSVAVAVGGILPGDVPVREQVLEARTPLIHEIARWVNHAGTWRVIVPVGALVLLLSPVARRSWWLWCAALAAAGLAETLAKHAVGRPRPAVGSMGFPSGHATAAAAFGALLIYIASRESLPRGQRRVTYAAVALLVAGVGLARIILDAHWASDVLGGFLLGTGFAAAAAWWDGSRGAAR